MRDPAAALERVDFFDDVFERGFDLDFDLELDFEFVFAFVFVFAEAAARLDAVEVFFFRLDEAPAADFLAAVDFFLVDVLVFFFDFADFAVELPLAPEPAVFLRVDFFAVFFFVDAAFFFFVFDAVFFFPVPDPALPDRLDAAALAEASREDPDPLERDSDFRVELFFVVFLATGPLPVTG